MKSKKKEFELKVVNLEYFCVDFSEEARKIRKYSERKTGFQNLDEKQNFMAGMYAVGGLPAVGKTTFALQLAYQVAEKSQAEKCLYLSYEQTTHFLMSKLLAREFFKEHRDTDLTAVDIAKNGENCFDLYDFREKLFGKAKSDEKERKIDFQVAYVDQSAETLIEYFESHFEKDAEEHAKKMPTLLVIDYLQRMPHDKSDAKSGVDDTIFRLKEFQQKYDLTLIVLSSFNRNSYHRRADFGSFKESGGIEYTADVVWALETDSFDEAGVYDSARARKENKKSIREIKLTCLKNRFGGQYECDFVYYAAHDYFAERNSDSEEKFEEKPQTEF